MKASYEALNGVEAAKLAVRAFANMVSGIPGFNSRLITFPKLKLTVTISVESFERENIERSELLEFTERAIQESIDAGAQPLAEETYTQEFSDTIDETEHPPDEIREAIGVPTVQPRRLDNGQIVDVNPLPGGENLSNIVSADGESPLGPHGGRVIDQAPLSDREKKGPVEIGPKMKGDVTHFRVRKAE